MSFNRIKKLAITLSIASALVSAHGVSATDDPTQTPYIPVIPVAQEVPVSPAEQAYDFGERGSSVRNLQRLLGIRADGFYGPITWAAHRAYLNSMGLSTKNLPELPKEYWTGWYPVKYKGKVVRLPLDKTKRCPKYEDEFRKHKLPVDIFSYIAWRESRCEPKAIGWNYKSGMTYRDCRRSPAASYKKCKAVSSYDSGLVQVNSSWVTLTAQACGTKYGDMTVLLEVDCNLKAAKRIMDTSSDPLGNWGF